MELKRISDASEIVLPSSFTCPICEMAIYVEDVDSWEEDEDGNMKAEAVKIDCVSSPDFSGDDDSEAMNDHLQSHWQMPYVDWLPLETALLHECYYPKYQDEVAISLSLYSYRASQDASSGSAMNSLVTAL